MNEKIILLSITCIIFIVSIVVLVFLLIKKQKLINKYIVNYDLLSNNYGKVIKNFKILKLKCKNLIMNNGILKMEKETLSKKYDKLIVSLDYANDQLSLFEDVDIKGEKPCKR